MSTPLEEEAAGAQELFSGSPPEVALESERQVLDQGQEEAEEEAEEEAKQEEAKQEAEHQEAEQEEADQEETKQEEAEQEETRQEAATQYELQKDASECQRVQAEGENMAEETAEAAASAETQEAAATVELSELAPDAGRSETSDMKGGIVEAEPKDPVNEATREHSASEAADVKDPDAVETDIDDTEKEHRHRRHHRKRRRHREKKDTKEPEKSLSRWDKQLKEMEKFLVPFKTRKESQEYRARQEAERQMKKRAREEETDDEGKDSVAFSATTPEKSKARGRKYLSGASDIPMVKMAASVKSGKVASAKPSARPRGRPRKDGSVLSAPTVFNRSRLQRGSSASASSVEFCDTSARAKSRLGAQTTGGRSVRSRAPARPSHPAIAKAVRTGSFRDVVNACENAKSASQGPFHLRDDLVFNLALRPPKDRDSEDSVSICKYLVQDLGLDFDVLDDAKRTPMFHILSKGLSALSSALISLGADVNHVDAKGETPMYVAAKAGSYNCVKELLENHASVNKGNSFGMAPLGIATQEGKLDVMQLLLDNGADVTAADSKNRTALFFAKTPETCEMLLQASADVNAQQTQGQTALFLSAKHGHQTLTNVLLQWKADVNIQDSNKQTALHWATHKNQVAMCKMLFDSTADPTCEDKNGVTPKDLALEPVWKPSKEMSKLYRKFLSVWRPGKSEGREAAARHHRGESESAASSAVLGKKWDRIVETACYGLMDGHTGHTSRYERIIEDAFVLGADVNSTCFPDGRTALGEAAFKESSALCRFLLEQRADVDRPDAAGCTPVFHAASKNVDLKVCSMLIAADANVNHLDNKGRSCLFNAAASGHASICEYLLERSCNANIVDNKEHTALIEAVLAGHSSTALILFKSTEVAVGHSISTDELSVIGDKAKSLCLDDISSFFLRMKADRDQDLAAESLAETLRGRARTTKRSRSRPQALTPARDRSAGREEELEQTSLDKIEHLEQKFPGAHNMWFVLDHVAGDNRRVLSGSQEDLQLLELGKATIGKSAVSDAGDKSLLEFLNSRNFSCTQLSKRQKVR